MAGRLRLLWTALRHAGADDEHRARHPRHLIAKPLYHRQQRFQSCRDLRCSMLDSRKILEARADDIAGASQQTKLLQDMRTRAPPGGTLSGAVHFLVLLLISMFSPNGQKPAQNKVPVSGTHFGSKTGFKKVETLS